MNPAEALPTQEDVELAERLNDGVSERIDALMSELRSLLRQARLSPKTIAQRAAFAKLEASRIASAPKLDDLIGGVAEAAARGDIRSPDHPEERAIDDAFMAWQREKIASGAADDFRDAALARVHALINGEVRGREAADEIRTPHVVDAVKVAQAIQVLDEEEEPE